MNFLKKIRILPIAIFLIAIFLCNKLIVVAFSFSENSHHFLNHVSVAFAESNTTPDPALNLETQKSREKMAKDEVPTEVDQYDIKKKIVKDNGFEEIVLDYSNYKKPEAPEKVPFKSAYDQEEIRLLEQLKERRQELMKKEVELAKKNKLLEVTEGKVDQKIKELEEIRADIQKKLKTLNQEQEQQILSLVKTYESMKPKSAASIFNDLDVAILIEIVERMKEAKRAPILAVMQPEKVTLITSILATRKKIPG